MNKRPVSFAVPNLFPGVCSELQLDTISIDFTIRLFADTIKSYQNGGGTFEWTNGGRPIQFSAPPPIGSSSSAHQRSISPHDPLQSIQEWQDGLKALLPNVNVTLAPELLSTGGCGVIKQSPPSKQQPLSANRKFLR
jgi:hypothetical protein